MICAAWERTLKSPSPARWKSVAQMTTDAAHIDNDPGLFELAAAAWEKVNEATKDSGGGGCHA